MIYFYLSIFLYSLVARILRWVSIIQQKEYRLDRLLSYLNSKEGNTQLKKFVDFPLKKTSLTRPSFTPKSSLITIFTFFLFFFTTSNNNAFILAGKYIALPVYALIATLPFTLLTKIITKYYQHKAKKLIKLHRPTIIGITGSYGKTTTKQLISHLLGAKYSVWQSPKSFNTPLSLPKSFVETYTSQKLVVLEYAAYKKGEIKTLTDIFPPSLGVLTGLNYQHIGLFGSFKNLVKAKKELFDALPSKSIVFTPKKSKKANLLLSKLKDHRIQYTKNIVTDTKLNSSGQYCGKVQNKKFTSKLIGNLYHNNLSLAVAIAKHYKLTSQQIAKQIDSFTPTPMFVNKIKSCTGYTIIDDGRTSNPTGFNAILKLSNSLKNTHKIIITPGFVDLGTEQSQQHQKLKPKLKTFDYVFDISKSGIKEFETLKNILHTTSNQQIIKKIQELDPKNTLIVLEGKMPPKLTTQIKNL
jgi:UDP-N-acetylmuramoyl-tripeptide--D-alanyl-D-alanine ligase